MGENCGLKDYGSVKQLGEGGGKHLCHNFIQSLGKMVNLALQCGGGGIVVHSDLPTQRVWSAAMNDLNLS